MRSLHQGEASPDANSFIFISKTNKQKAQPNLLFFFFFFELHCSGFLFPPFQISHSFLSLIFILCKNKYFVCADSNSLWANTGINKNKYISHDRKEQCSLFDPERGGCFPTTQAHPSSLPGCSGDGPVDGSQSMNAPQWPSLRAGKGGFDYMTNINP